MRSHVEALLCASDTRSGSRGHAWATQRISLVNHGWERDQENRAGPSSRRPCQGVLCALQQWLSREEGPRRVAGEECSLWRVGGEKLARVPGGGHF